MQVMKRNRKNDVLFNRHVDGDKDGALTVLMVWHSLAELILIDEAGYKIRFFLVGAPEEELNVSELAEVIPVSIERAENVNIRYRRVYEFADY